MILTTEIALKNLVRTLQEDIAPALAEPFLIESARLSALLLTICANWMDDAAAVRVAENAGLRLLFGEAVASVTDAGLASNLREAACSADPGLKVSELDLENERLRELLMRLHAHVEMLVGADARSLDQRIWCYLEHAQAARAPRR